ncbi:MAG: PAS domain S-box protein [Bryobacteraceae bacterium]
MERISVLLVEDNPGDARLLREAVREAEGSQIQLTHVDTLAKALAKLQSDRFDVVMLDLSLPDADGLATLTRTHAQAPSIPIVVITGLDDEALAIRALREGAQDYLVKGQVTSQVLVRSMRYATQRKRAVEEIQQSEEYFRSLIENALDVITVLDTGGTLRYGSPSFERVLGYPAGALHECNVFSLIHPDDRGHVQEMLEVGKRNPGATQFLVYRLRHRNGTWRVIEAIGKRFEEGSLVNGFVLNSRDVTERKRSEEDLRQANETLKAVIETSPLAIYGLDRNGAVKSWNSAASRIFGYTEEETINTFLPIVSREHIPNFLEKLDACAQGVLLTGGEERRCRKDGTPIDVSVWNAQLRDAAGSVTGIVEAVADNTERKRLEEQFRQVQKMEAVGRLAGGVAHDFNNLLTVITGYCQMMLDQLPAADPMAQDLQQVLRASARATSLTKQLLAFSRKQIVQPKVIDFLALVLEMRPMLDRLLGPTFVLKIESVPGSGQVRVDPGQLEQVIVNLTVNARDAMASGGELRLVLRNELIAEPLVCQHTTLPSGEYVALHVIDHGIGIDEITRSHLFEPFFTTKEKGHGTGLGLSTSYGIVKQNHGELLVKSEVGKGTEFSVYLPRVEEPVDVDLPKARRRHLRGRETILLAEDEDGVRTVLTDMLSKQGYRVLAASGGEQALKIAEAHSGRIQLDLRYGNARYGWQRTC